MNADLTLYHKRQWESKGVHARAAMGLRCHQSFSRSLPRLDLVPFILHLPQVWTLLHLPLRKETPPLPQRRPSSDPHRSKRHLTLSTSKCRH